MDSRQVSSTLPKAGGVFLKGLFIPTGLKKQSRNSISKEEIVAYGFMICRSLS
jgi:hypothetical protein